MSSDAKNLNHAQRFLKTREGHGKVTPAVRISQEVQDTVLPSGPHAKWADFVEKVRLELCWTLEDMCDFTGIKIGWLKKARNGQNIRGGYREMFENSIIKEWAIKFPKKSPLDFPAWIGNAPWSAMDIAASALLANISPSNAESRTVEGTVSTSPLNSSITDYGISKSPEEMFLEQNHYIYTWQCGASDSEIQELCVAGKARLIESGNIYVPTATKLRALLAERAATIPQLALSLGVDPAWLENEFQRGGINHRNHLGTITLSPSPTKLVVFDWTYTLVDDYELDENICAYIPKASGHADERRRNDFLRMLSDLERDFNKRWYDYEYLGRYFGKSTNDLIEQHRKFASLMKSLVRFDKLLVPLKKLHIKVALATNSHKQVLKWRLALLHLKETDFDYVVTSSDVSNVRDKSCYFDVILRLSRLLPEEIMIVSDDLEKDIFPAKAMNLTTAWYPAAPKRPRGEFGSGGLPVHQLSLFKVRQKVLGLPYDYVLMNPTDVLNVVAR